MNDKIRRAKKITSSGNVRRIMTGVPTRTRIRDEDCSDSDNKSNSNYSQELSQILCQSEETLSEIEKEVQSAKTRNPFTLYSNHPPSPKRNVSASHCEYCYCRSSPIPPQLSLKPPRRPESAPQAYPKLKYKRPQKCYCQKSNDSIHGQTILDQVHSSVNYTPESIFLKRLREESHKNCQCPCMGRNKLGFTEVRDLYERMFRESQMMNGCLDKEEEELGNSKAGGELNDSFIEQSFKHNKEGSTESQVEIQGRGSCSLLAEDPNLLEKLRQFRDDKFFETHSTGDLQDKSIPEHECVHKFTLNDDLQPVPINPDSSGVSRCVICNKSMSNTNPVKNRVDTRRQSKEKVLEKTPVSIPKKPLVPRKLNFLGANEKMEIEIPAHLKKVVELAGKGLPARPKSPPLRDSLALRHQRRAI